MDPRENLITIMLQRFVWLDEGLQAHMRRAGWPEVTRPQSMVMANVVAGARRPADIARSLGVSRQAIHTTIRQMTDIGMLTLEPDPQDKRSKIVAIAPLGEKMRDSAREAMSGMVRLLRERLGEAVMVQLGDALWADWGEPPDWSQGGA